MVKRKNTNFFIKGRLLFLAAIFFLVMLIGGIIFKSTIWNGSRRFTIVIDGDPLYLFSIEPVTNTAAIVIIPSNTILDVPFDYNGYQAKAIYSLGKMDAKRSGGKLLTKSIENTFGILTEGYIAAKGDRKYSLPINPEDIFQLKKKYFSMISLVPTFFMIYTGENIMTNLSFLDLIRLWFSIHNLRSDQISIIIPDKNNIVKNEKLPDESEVKILDKDLFDLSLQSNFQDQRVRMQNIAIEIVNATGKQNIANQFGRMLTHLGANVVTKSSSDSIKELKCRIIIFNNHILSSIIISRLLDTYKCSVEETKEEGVADVKIILGEEFIK